MRPFCVLLHRYVGLFMVPFLFVTGLTGAIISWDHELDDLLNPHLMQAQGREPAIPSLELARQIEARDPRVQVSFVPLTAEIGESLHFGVQPRIDPATGRFFEPGYNQVFIDPANGVELGRREWGAVWPIARETFVSFLYKLHFSLHFPEMWGSDRWGIWLLGITAILWTVDCFTGVYLALPASRRNTDNTPRRSWWQRWKPSWRIRQGAGTYKLNYDLHRAGSLWTWALLFILAFTAFSLNLYREVFYPLLSTVSQVTPTPFDTRVPADPLHPIDASVGFTTIVERAHAEAQRRHWSEPPGSVFYSTAFGVYGVQFFHPGGDHGAAGVGPARLFFDGEDGRLVGERLPWQGTVADIFVQAQFPLHSGRLLGLPGRILISVMGLVVAMLSVTGAYVWWRKRRGRMQRRLGSKTNSATNQAPTTYHSAHRFSTRGIVGIVAAHAAVLALLTSLNVVPLPPPLATLMVQIIAPTPPAPEISPPRPTPVESKPAVRPKPTPVTPVTRQPPLAAPAEASQATAEVPIVRETPPPAPSSAATAAVSQPRFDADYLLNPAPVYPALSRKLGEEGKVVLRVFVETTGRPSQIEIKTGSASPRLDQAAQDAVWRWKFVPARRGEEATGAWVLVPIVFNLRS